MRSIPAMLLLGVRAMKLLAKALRILVSALAGSGAFAVGAMLLAGPAAQAWEHVHLMPRLGTMALPQLL
jgi:hypothetical protein